MENNNTPQVEQTPGSHQDPPITNENSEPILAPQPPKSRKKLIIMVAVGLLVAISAALWFMTNDKKPDTSTTTTNQPTTTQQPTSANLKPFAVAYSFSADNGNNNEFFWRPVGSGERTSAGKVGSGSSISFSDIYKDQVVVVTNPLSSGGKLAIRYSNDAGKSYNTLFEGAPLGADQLGDQITSIRFSIDGSKIVFGYSLSMKDDNIVKELDPQTKAVKDLFSVDDIGVFIDAYDAKTKKAMYYTGCYNCDGNTRAKLYSQIEGGKQELVYSLPEGHIGLGSVMTSDLSKMINVHGVAGEFLGSAPPYSVDEYDFTTKTTKVLATVNAEVLYSGYGYQEGTQQPYYTSGKTIFGVNKDGKSVALFESSKNIVQVLYVGSDQIVVSSGDYTNYQLVNFNVGTKAVTNLLNGDGGTNLFGVTWQ